MSASVANRFNLVDEKWIPIANHGLASLSDVFSQPEFTALGGTPTEKISLTKLLLAIAQSAYTPKDDDEWRELGSMGMAEKALAYLTKQRACFWLYGEKPFLQMNGASKLKKKGFASLIPHMVATGQNTSMLFQSQVERELSDDEKAVLVVHLMGFALGGKQVDNSCPLSNGYRGNLNHKGNCASGRDGSQTGYLHGFLQGKTMQETIWLNLFSHEQVGQLTYFTAKVGKAPWEGMPVGEDCDIAKALRCSYMGTLIPMCRFLYLSSDGIHNADGILYDRGSKQKPARDPDPSLTFTPTIAVQRSQQKFVIMLADPDKRPWRELTSLLSFFENDSYECIQLRVGLQRVRKYLTDYTFSVWVGGMSFDDKGGEHAPRGTDDFVESNIVFNSAWLGEPWYLRLKDEMANVEKIADIVKRHVYQYFSVLHNTDKRKRKDFKADNRAKKASSLFWELAERLFPALMQACNTSTPKTLRPLFAEAAFKAYDTHCPRDTARQLDAWAANRPKLGKYLVSTATNQPSNNS